MDLDLPQLVDQLTLPVIRPPLSPSHGQTVLDLLDQPFTLTPLLSSAPASLPKTLPAINALLKTPVLSTGSSSIDTLLEGGISLGQGGIFEIYGAAGSGKTQLALQLCLKCTLPTPSTGLDSWAILAVTEGAPPMKRLEQMERQFCLRNGLPERTLLQRIVVERIGDVDELLTWAKFRLPWLLRETGAKVVVLDSVAAVYRPEFEDALSRAPHLLAMATALKAAMARVGGVCVCVNQVSQRPGGNIVPALGAVWRYCVGGSLELEKKGGRRFAKLRGESVQFEVDDSGIVDVDEG